MQFDAFPNISTHNKVEPGGCHDDALGSSSCVGVRLDHTVDDRQQKGSSLARTSLDGSLGVLVGHKTAMRHQSRYDNFLVSSVDLEKLLKGGINYKTLLISRQGANLIGYF